MTDLTFANLVDTDQIRELLEAHYKITGIGAAILDRDENVMVAVGYHDICTRFHLVHPLTKLNCRESDAYIKAHLSECNGGYLDYRCKNGLVDVAVPIIIRGEHLATFFTGQFFYDDDEPDVEYFRKQAENFGFEETGYLEALGRVPVFTRDHIRKIVEYYRHLVGIIAGMGLKNLELRNGASERNEAEEALLLSRFCIDKAGIGIYHTDENGTIFSVNDYACASLGYSKEELCALTVFDIDPAITPEKMLEIKKTLDTSGAATFETIHRRKDGSAFPVEITVNVLEFNGRTFGISFVKDITERKRAEEERRKSEENFSIIFQATPDLIAITRAGDGTILEVNEAFSRLLGYSRPEAIGKCTEELSIWADPADRARWMAELEATGQVNEFETTLRCRDGSLITCVSTARPLDFGGEKCVLSVVRDITERKRAEEALRASEAEKALILNSTMDYVMYHDPDMKIVWANRNAGKLAKLPVEDLIGRHCWKVVHKRDIPCEDCPVILARDTGEPQKIEKRHINGLTLIMRAYPIKNGQGRLMGIAEFVSDITERKQAEEALRKSRQMLMSVLDNFPGVVFWKDRNSVYMGCNRNFSLAAGLSEPSEIVGKNDHELPWKNDAEWYLADDRQVIESGVPKLNIIETLLHADGRVAWFETSKVPLFDEDGKVFAVLGSSNDITERKRMEEELLSSEKKYRSIVDAYDGFIYICSQNYRIEFMNQKLIERTGYGAVSELCYRVLHDTDPSAHGV